jgi:hypothetical protein
MAIWILPFFNDTTDSFLVKIDYASEQVLSAIDGLTDSVKAAESADDIVASIDRFGTSISESSHTFENLASNHAGTVDPVKYWTHASNVMLPQMNRAETRFNTALEEIRDEWKTNAKIMDAHKRLQSTFE